jgi:hypothetical protein
VLEREVLKAADLFRVEGLLEHCVEAFGRGLKVSTAIEQLVWAHSDGPAEARKVGTEFFVRNCRRIRVGTIYSCVQFSLPFVFLYHVEQILARQGFMQFGSRAQSVFFVYDCIALISIFHFVYVAWFGQQEARETWQPLKLLCGSSGDVHHDILEAMVD